MKKYVKKVLFFGEGIEFSLFLWKKRLIFTHFFTFSTEFSTADCGKLFAFSFR